MIFKQISLRDHWELANKLGIWDYQRFTLVSAAITGKLIRLAAERHGWRQRLSLEVSRSAWLAEAEWLDRVEIMKITRIV